MDPEELKARIQELQAQLQGKQDQVDKIIADMNAINGAIQENKRWLDKLGAE